jgi:hypothetical protein
MVRSGGVASDTFRFNLISYMGGFYSDLDYIFNKGLEDERYQYDFIGTDLGGIFADVFFFGSTPGHPILLRILDLLGRNFYSPPDYIAVLPKNSVNGTCLRTAQTMYIAYYTRANQHGTIDVLYPYNISWEHCAPNGVLPIYYPTKEGHVSMKLDRLLQVIAEHCKDCSEDIEFIIDECRFYGGIAEITGTPTGILKGDKQRFDVGKNRGKRTWLAP